MVVRKEAVTAKPKRLTKRQREILQFQQEHPKDEILNEMDEGLRKMQDGLISLLKGNYYDQERINHYSTTSIDRMYVLLSLIDMDFQKLYTE